MTGAHVIERSDLLRALAGHGYTIVGPTLREQAIVYCFHECGPTA